LIFGNEIKKNSETDKIGETSLQLIRRRRSFNQTTEKKVAWDREIKDIRNAKIRERRA
jgi:hypothetical protein